MSDPTTPTTLRQLNELVLSPELREVEALLANFNLFRVLRFEHGEIRHSNVLAWLLQPDESHGLRDAFLRRWLMRIHHDVPEAKLAAVEVDALGIRSVRVKREWGTGDGSLDLLIRIQTFDEGEWVVAIENKVWSPESPGQLERYRRAVEAAFPHSRRLFVFLSRRDQEPADKAWLRGDYEQVRDELKALLREQNDLIGPEPAVLIRHYLEILEETSMSQDRIAELAKKLYQNHRLALDAILEHRPDYVRDLSDLLEAQFREDAGALGLRPMLCQKGLVRFLPSEWATPANLAGGAWGQTDSAFILIQVYVSDEDAPFFSMVEGQSPEAWRNELWDLAKAHKFQTVQDRTRKPKKWMTVFSVKADFYVGEESIPDPREAARKTWQWVREVLLSAECKHAMAEIGAHLAKLPSSLTEK